MGTAQFGHKCLNVHFVLFRHPKIRLLVAVAVVVFVVIIFFLKNKKKKKKKPKKKHQSGSNNYVVGQGKFEMRRHYNSSYWMYIVKSSLKPERICSNITTFLLLNQLHTSISSLHTVFFSQEPGCLVGRAPDS